MRVQIEATAQAEPVDVKWVEAELGNIEQSERTSSSH
jgi:hypothetical protein